MTTEPKFRRAFDENDLEEMLTRWHGGQAWCDPVECTNEIRRCYEIIQRAVEMADFVAHDAKGIEAAHWLISKERAHDFLEMVK